MLATHFSSLHEPACDETIEQLLRWLTGEYADEAMVRILAGRDAFLGLEMEASHYLHYAVPLLVARYPRAIFVLTVREPCSWLNSEIRQNLVTRSFPLWRRLEAFRYERYGFRFDREQAALAALDNVYPIASYLSYWTDHYRLVLDAVPPERLVIVDTAALAECAATLAGALAIDAARINTARAHAARRPDAEWDLFTLIDRDYVTDQVRARCAPDVVARIFPRGLPAAMASVQP